MISQLQTLGENEGEREHFQNCTSNPVSHTSIWRFLKNTLTSVVPPPMPMIISEVQYGDKLVALQTCIYDSHAKTGDFGLTVERANHNEECAPYTRQNSVYAFESFEQIEKKAYTTGRSIFDKQSALMCNALVGQLTEEKAEDFCNEFKCRKLYANENPTVVYSMLIFVRKHSAISETAIDFHANFKRCVLIILQLMNGYLDSDNNNAKSSVIDIADAQATANPNSSALAQKCWVKSGGV
jgi:hypothetical protein